MLDLGFEMFLLSRNINKILRNDLGYSLTSTKNNNSAVLDQNAGFVDAKVVIGAIDCHVPY